VRLGFFLGVLEISPAGGLSPLFVARLKR
jgi:hypothetical protein